MSCPRVGVNVNGVFLFATNIRAGTVDVFAPAPANSATGFYVPATTDGGFQDPNIQKGLYDVQYSGWVAATSQPYIISLKVWLGSNSAVPSPSPERPD
jgi:hypothetical protein